MTDTDMLYMTSLEKRNAELEARVAELEEKHWNECRQIAHYDDELKDLREENKVLMQECDRLIKEKGELLKKSEQIAEYKRLLKAAVEGMCWLNENTQDSYGSCTIRTEHGCSGCPLDINGDLFCKWKHEAEALALIGEDTNVPASADDTNVGHKFCGWIKGR